MTDSLSGYLAYTWLDARFDRYLNRNGDDLAGNRLPGVPRHSLYAELAWQTNRRLQHSAGNAKPQPSLRQRHQQRRSAWLRRLQLRASYHQQLGGWQLEPFARIDNLTIASSTSAH
ncbi:hypothetical protein ULG90_15110 [Halopseudomonas pachastrellae]|nr:hypothetical protein ULG90_15110 [Halopseudomonas pachastrellae]